MHWQLHLSHDDEAVGLHVFVFIYLSLSCIKPSSASSTKPTMTQVQIQFKCFSTMQSKDHEVLSISFEQFNKYSICPQKPATGGRNKTQEKQKQRDVWGGEAISSAASLTFSGRLWSRDVAENRHLSLLLISARYATSSHRPVPSGTLLPVCLTPLRFLPQNLIQFQLTPISSRHTVRAGCFGWRLRGLCWLGGFWPHIHNMFPQMITQHMRKYVREQVDDGESYSFFSFLFKNKIYVELTTKMWLKWYEIRAHVVHICTVTWSVFNKTVRIFAWMCENEEKTSRALR